MEYDTDADETMSRSELEEQLKIAHEQIETYQMLNRDISGKAQEYKILLNQANAEIQRTRHQVIEENANSCELRRTLRVMHAQFTKFYADYASLMETLVRNTGFDLTFTPDVPGTSALLFKPPSKMAGNYDAHDTNILNTIREESQFSSFSENQSVSQVAAPPETSSTHGSQYETPMRQPPAVQPSINRNVTDTPDLSSVSATLRPKVFSAVNHESSNISTFSVASDATSTPFPALKVHEAVRPPSTIHEENEGSSQHVHKGLIGETPRRRSENSSVRPPPVRRISEESIQEDTTTSIVRPESSVERELRAAFCERSQSPRMLQGNESQAFDDSASENDLSQDWSHRNTRRDAIIPTRRRSSYDPSQMLDEIQEENLSNKENNQPSPQSVQENTESIPAKADQTQKNKRRAEPKNYHESPTSDTETVAPVVENEKKRRELPRRVAEIATDDEDEEPVALKPPPKKTQKQPAKTKQKKQKSHDSDSEEEVVPTKRSRTRKNVASEISSGDEEVEMFADALADVPANSSDEEQSSEDQHDPVTRTCSVEVNRLNPSESMLEAFNGINEQPDARERSPGATTEAGSEVSEATTKKSRKRDLSRDSKDSELSEATSKKRSPRKRDLSRESVDSDASTAVSVASTSTAASTTSRKRKPKEVPLRKSRPPRRKAVLPPGSLIERPLGTKLRR